MPQSERRESGVTALLRDETCLDGTGELFCAHAGKFAIEHPRMA